MNDLILPNLLKSGDDFLIDYGGIVRITDKIIIVEMAAHEVKISFPQYRICSALEKASVSACTVTDSDPVWIMHGLRCVYRDGNGTVSCYIQNKADATHVGHHV
jgi:hypothetical protein